MQTLPPVRIGRQRSHDYFNWKNRFYVNFNRYAKRTRHERSKIAQRRYEKQVRLHMARTIAAVEQTGAQRMQQLYEELFGTQAQIKSSLTRTTKWMVNLLMIFVLSGCGALFGDKDKDNAMSIDLTPLEARVGVPFTAELRVTDMDGILRVRVTSPDSSWVYNGAGRTNVIFYIPKEFKAPGKRTIRVEGVDLESREYTSTFDIDVVGSQIVVATKSDHIDKIEFDISVRGESLLEEVVLNYGVGVLPMAAFGTDFDTTITREFGGVGGRIDFEVLARDRSGLTTTRTGFVDLVGLTDINLIWRTYLDETPVDGAQMHLTHREIDFDTTLTSQNGLLNARVPRGEYAVFLHANPSMRLPSKGGPVGFENFVEGNGEYVSNISRIRLGRDFLPSKYNGSFWHGRNETFVLSGPQIMHELQLSILSYEAEKAVILGPGFDVDFYLSLNRNLSTVIETLENNYYSYPVVYRGIRGGYTLEELSRQTANGFGSPRVPLASEPLVFAFNWGDSNCKEGWNTWTDTVCTVGRVPGALASDDVKEGFRLFYRDLTSILDGPKIGINPYLVEMIEGYSEDISDRIIGNPDFFDNLINPGRSMTSPLRNGVLYYGLTNGNIMAENDVRNRGPPYTQDKTLSKILARFPREYYDAAVSRPAVYAGGAVNESRFIGEVENMFVSEIKESYQEEDIWRIPMFGSSRDPPTIMLQLGFNYLHPDYGVIPVRRTFLDKDVRNIKILHGYAPFAQQQYLTQAIRQQIRDFVIEHGGTEWQSNSLSSSRETGFNMQFYNRYQDIP